MQSNRSSVLARPRILVVTNETAEGDFLHRTIRERARALGTTVTVVAPALNSRLRHWLSDEDSARAAAEARLARCLRALHSLGVCADGWVGDADPMRAIADAVAVARFDEIVIATHPEERSNWLAQELPARARRVFELPVAHIIVDSVAHREYVAATRIGEGEMSAETQILALSGVPAGGTVGVSSVAHLSGPAAWGRLREAVAASERGGS